MNDRQFEQLLNNARRPAPLPFFAGKAVHNFLRTARKRSRAFQAGDAAWRRVARPEWLTYTQFDSHENGEFCVAVSHPVLAAELRQKEPEIRRLLATQLASVARIRFRAVATLADES